MAKVQLNIRIDERIFNAMAGMEKSVVVRTALANHLKLDLDTLIPLDELELAHEARRLQLKQVSKPKVIPKTYPADGTDEEKIAFREAEGFVQGADPNHPAAWAKLTTYPNGAQTYTKWHYDPDVRATFIPKAGYITIDPSNIKPKAHQPDVSPADIDVDIDPEWEAQFKAEFERDFQ